MGTAVLRSPPLAARARRRAARRRRGRAGSARGRAHCTANGEALLAALADEEVERLLPATLEKLTPKTLTSRTKLLEELRQVRHDGIAFDREEHTPGICAVGTAVAAPDGTVAAITVPLPAFYLHPRNPLPNQRRIYEGRSELLGPTWAFAVETGTHALRLITSGLFDRFPRLTLILGHLGEFLPFALNRLEQRISHIPHVNLERSPTQVLRENFYVTTSGNNHTPSLIGILLELGADRLLFAADYPFEEMTDGATWFDTVPISELDREKIGRTNAQQVFGI